MGKFIDLTGKQFGKLVVIKKVRKIGYRRPHWLCRCDCGNELIRITSSLKTKGFKGCDECVRQEARKRHLVDITGQRFGRLLVIKYIKERVKWECKCDCGNVTYVYSGHLRSGFTRSCGCLNREAVSKRHKNIPLSEKTKEKIGKSGKGKHEMSKEDRERMGKKERGEKHWNWKGGISPLAERIRRSLKYKLWRKSVYERDNYTCQKCGGYKGNRLNAHHNIKSFSLIWELNNIKTYEQAEKCAELWDVNNGITLCEECHSLTIRRRS